MYQFNEEEYNARMTWYRDARFGMFLHWGLYSIPARGEWVMADERIPAEEYKKYFTRFNEIKKELKSNLGDDKERQRQLDLLKYQVNEIEAASLIDGEEDKEFADGAINFKEVFRKEA